MPTRRLVIFLVAEFALGAVFGFSLARATAASIPPPRTLPALAQRLGAPVPVDCLSWQAWQADSYVASAGAIDGYTHFNVDGTPAYIVLSPDTCQRARLALRPRPSALLEDRFVALGLLELVHETQHVRLRTLDESTVECAAMGLYPRV